MELRNCKSCNRLFQYIGGSPLCPQCRESLEEKFGEVKEYIYEHPGQTMSQVSEAMDISIKQIKQWIREDRLVLSEAAADGVTCEHCGVPIRSGRYCEKCKNKMVNKLSATISHPAKERPEKKPGIKESKENKMRFLSQQ